jgi:hypothetical protein
MSFEFENDLKLGILKNELSKRLLKEHELIEKKKEYQLEIISLKKLMMRIID